MSTPSGLKPREDDFSHTQPPLVTVRAPTTLATTAISKDNASEEKSSLLQRRLRRKSTVAPLSPAQHRRHVSIEERAEGHASPSSRPSSIYMGSYSRGRSRASHGSRTPVTPKTARSSTNLSHLSDLLQDLNMDMETYGVEEHRDGFFDASFFKPSKTDRDEMMRDAEYTLPAAFRKKHPLSPKYFLPKQWAGIKSMFEAITTTRAGIKLTKTFSAVFIAYIMCLVPVVGDWLGRYNYVMVLSTILNHPGRTVGAQIDGAVLTTLGTAIGLGWGALALWTSTSTAEAQAGFGGILATSLIVFIGAIAAARSYYIRLYQLVLCAGISVIYTVMADASNSIHWRKVFDYGIPWVCGQAICLAICCTVFPDAGARPLAVCLHSAFGIMQQGLVLPHSDDITIHRQLAMTFVDLSQAYRDLVLDVSISRFAPKDVSALRNLMQAVIRSLLSLKVETDPIEEYEKTHRIRERKDEARPVEGHLNPQAGPSEEQAPVVIDIDTPRQHNHGRPTMQRTDTEERAMSVVVDKLADPTRELLTWMRKSLHRCDAVLMSMSGYRKYLGPPEDVSVDILGALTKIRKVMMRYDDAEERLLHDPNLPPTYSNHLDVVELFLFVHPIRQAAKSTEALLIKVMEMQQRKRGWRFYLPSYPISKSLNRTNAQVRHDRGGVTAGYFFRSQTQLAKSMKGMANIFHPLPRHFDEEKEAEAEAEAQDENLRQSLARTETVGRFVEAEDVVLQEGRKKRFSYRLWSVLHRLQGFETRFALKVIIVTSLLAIPAWLDHSRGWFNEFESWWAVVTAWIHMHPRVGGNVQDLVTRAFVGLLGAVWGGLAYGSGNGNPYVMAVFAAVFMIPMLYRFTQSSHPRSGLVGCMSFVVVSLGANVADGHPSIVQIAWTRGLAFMVGTISAVVVNWMLWPFVARHELRKALSAMMVYSSIIYRGKPPLRGVYAGLIVHRPGVVAKYVYYEQGKEPDKEDIEGSEVLEGRLREGFVRIRQLMALTRHEIRLRGPFDPLPYSALIDACERFFEYLVAVRQSSIFFHPHFLSDDEQAAESLLAFRRDAVASVLMNLYVLAGALRGGRKVPRYLPSAALARKRLLEHMQLIESLAAAPKDSCPSSESRPTSLVASDYSIVDLHPKEGTAVKWSQIYSVSYSQSLTGCVKQLDQLCKYTKQIVGEQGFDPPSPLYKDEEDNSEDDDEFPSSQQR